MHPEKFKMLDSQTIRPTVKHNLRFQEGVCHEKIKPDQIQNGRLSANIDTRGLSRAKEQTVRFWG